MSTLHPVRVYLNSKNNRQSLWRENMRRFLCLLIFLFLYSCSYTLQYKYPNPIPERKNYTLNGVNIFIVSDEKGFQAEVKRVFGEEDPECMSFVDPATMKDIWILSGKDGSINLYNLGHEIYYHIMERRRGH